MTAQRRRASRHRRAKHTETERKQLKKKGLIFSIVLLAFGILATVFYVADKRDIFSLDQFLDRDFNVVEIDGVRCRRKTRIKSYLFMGIDAPGKVGEETVEAGHGQCDVLELIVVDQNANTYTVFPISRDIVTPVTTVEEDGEIIGESSIQLAFAHASGDGGAVSCENVVRAVSRLLYDQPIDGYLSINLDGIGVINHELGGVTVKIEDDFSQVDTSMKIGDTIKLSDEQAVYYVRFRMQVGDGTNKARMRRQEQFLANAQPIFQEKLMADENFFSDFYKALGDYLVSSLTGKDISKLAKALRSNKYFEPPKITGEMSFDELGFTQMTADQESIRDAVIDLFYERL